MQYIEALTTYIDNQAQRSVFLAGGISGCYDWQADVSQMLAETSLVVLNPRRANFPINDPSQSQLQIQWEHEHLRKASAILFWFPPETLCPITLYELGTWSNSQKPIFIGVHPNYQRRIDVEIQTRLIRPDIIIVYSIPHLVDQLKAYATP